MVNQKQKGFIDILLVIVVVAFLSVGTYFIFAGQKSAPEPSPTPSPAPVPTPLPAPSPSPNPNPVPAGEIIVKKVGDQEGSFLIQKINQDSVEGIWYTAYPVPRDTGEARTLYIGDDIGYVCEGVSEKLVSIDYSAQTVTFNKVTGQVPTGGCPICLSGETQIDTPTGSVSVKDLHFGMTVWTVDKEGGRVRGLITKTSKVPVSDSHQMIHLVLANGQELLASPGHPTINGRTIRDLAVGEIYNGVRIVGSEYVSYNEGATYDILPSGDTGYYFANGILIDSTLK